MHFLSPNNLAFELKVLRPTRPKIGHFGHAFFQANLLASTEKTKPNTTKANIQKTKYYKTKN